MFIVVTSTSESKVGAVREAFQQTFGKAIVMAKVCFIDHTPSCYQFVKCYQQFDIIDLQTLLVKVR